METIKEEKKADLEQLLNSLIEKGWKPFGEDRIDKINWLEQYVGNWNWGCWSEKNSYWRWKSTRQIVSKESGLWQFVCENGMVDDGVEYKGYALVDVDGGAIAKYETGCRYLYSNIEPEFYIMESSLKDESELEDFLLQNIKVGD